MAISCGESDKVVAGIAHYFILPDPFLRNLASRRCLRFAPGVGRERVARLRAQKWVMGALPPAQFHSGTVQDVPVAQAVLAVAWIGIWVFCASFLLSQVPADYTPTDPWQAMAVAMAGQGHAQSHSNLAKKVTESPKDARPVLLVMCLKALLS